MSISDVIDSENVVQKIVTTLNQGSCTVALQAEEGRGKTYIVESIEKSFPEKNIKFIYLQGDSAKIEESYYPLNSYIEKKNKNFKKGVKILKEIAGGIKYIGSGLKAIIDEVDLGDSRSKKVIQNVPPFNNQLDFSLHLIGAVNKYEQVIIICDDFELFDQDTLNYLTALKAGFLAIGKPFPIAFIVTSERTSNAANLLGNAVYTYTLEPITFPQLNQIITIWSGGSPTKEQLEVIHSCTGGHLHLVKIVSAYFKEMIEKEKAPLYLSNNFLNVVIDARLKQLDTKYERVRSLLFAISNSGKSNSIQEVICLLGEDDDMQEIIRTVIRLNLVKVKDNYLSLSHPFIEHYIDSSKLPNKPSFYKKLSACVHRLTPGDYMRRATLESMTMNPERVDTLWALEAIREIRSGSKIGRSILDRISNTDVGSRLRGELDKFIVCYEYAFSGKLDETISSIEAISDSLPREIVSEKYYLLCETLAKKIAKQPKEAALNTVENWESVIVSEPEIWYRFMQVKILLSAELGLIDVAKRTESAIVSYFSDRITYDSNASSIIDRLSLFSDILYSPEVSHKKLLQVEQKLSSEVEQDSFHRLMDLYIARVNLSANSFTLHNYERAISSASSAIELINSYPEIYFPYKEVPLSNLILSTVFEGKNNLKESIESYARLHESTKIEENRILIDMNYAGLLFLNGSYNEAYQVLQQSSYIPNIETDDSFYSYYYWSNFALLSYIQGDKYVALEKLTFLKEVAPKVSHNLSKYYSKHWDTLNSILTSNETLNHNVVLSEFERLVPVYSSIIWKRFKSGYLFTDIQIWTSS